MCLLPVHLLQCRTIWKHLEFQVTIFSINNLTTIIRFQVTITIY